MFKNRKGEPKASDFDGKQEPKASDSSEKVEEEKIREDKKESGEDILRKALGEVESGEETRHLEDEAYKEKEKRERHEKAKQKEQEYQERHLRRALGEGASTYMLIKSTEGFEEMRKKREEVTSEVMDNARDKALGYLKERFDYEKDAYDFGRSLKGTWFGTRGQFLLFGPFTAKLEGRLTRESYLKELQECQKFADNKWTEKAEEVRKDEIFAIREKTDRGVVKNHLEGFGTAALEHGDVKTAVDAFIEGGSIKDVEIAKKVVEEMKELVKSKEPEIRAKALAAKESLEKYFAEKKAEKE